MATTGDILLFRGRSFSSRLQRALTRSTYDHVAMILKYKNGRMFLFEATGQSVGKGGFKLRAWIAASGVISSNSSGICCIRTWCGGS